MDGRAVQPLRTIFGVCLVVQFLGGLGRDSFSSALAIIGIVAALFLIAGLHDRGAALVACSVMTWLCLRNGLLASLSVAFVLWLLLAHAVLPRAPYGSWSARSRVDPTGWYMPAAIVSASRVVLLIGAGWVAIKWLREDRITLHLGELFPGIALLLFFTLDPKWVAPRWRDRRDRIFYDGTCVLCHGSTRFVLSEDRLETAFTFAPLQGDAGAAAVALAERGDVPDSIVVKTETGPVLARSDAVIYVLERLGGAWRVIAVVMKCVPKRLRDAVYDLVARVRYRVFGRAETLCPILPAHLRSRFHD